MHFPQISLPVSIGLLLGGALVGFVSGDVDALAMILGSDSSWLNGLHLGLLVGLCWVATAYGITYLFEQRSLCIFMINAGYYIVSYIIMGTIIGAWPTTSV